MRRPPVSPVETLDAVARDVRARRRPCVDVLEACLARIDAREAEVRAWVVVDREAALARARRLDEEADAGAIRGPLHGVPVGIKDIVDVAGLPTGAGARRWADGPAAADATLVARLRDAGAVIVGKTATTPYAWIDPPATANPFDRARTPGGSSSGSAAAVACGMCLAAVGSQTGGSIIRPAAFCGVAGLKPTAGRLALDGFVPLAPSLDHPGLVAPTALDLALVWQALTGEEVGHRARRPIRVGHLGGMFVDRAEPAMRAAVAAWLEGARSRGAEVVPLEPPVDLDALLRSHRTILAAEAAAVHADRFDRLPDDYPPRMARLILDGRAIDGDALLEARRHQRRARREVAAFFPGVDVLVMPAAPGAAPDRSTTGDPSFQSPWSFLGLPALTVPAARDEAGLPLGVQLVAPAGGEPLLLAFGS